MTGKTDNRLDRLFLLGRPFSPLYGFLMAIRSTLFDKGFFKQEKLEVPVISVGNIVLGGTGKTPLVLYLAKLLQKLKKKPAILSRGYKGSAAHDVNVVASTSEILLGAAAAGDEPRLLAEKLSGVPVITGKKRFNTGRYAIDTFGADCLILDDGFQHMALRRDLDLVLFNARKCLGNGRVLPAGHLREPLSALKRADAFIITDTGATPTRTSEQLIGSLKSLYPENPIFTGAYQAVRELPRLYGGNRDSMSLEDASKIAVYGFCGIAGPESFENTLRKNGMNLTGFKAFADHHSYSADDIRLLLDNASTSGASALITTEKDLVKLHSIFPVEFILLALPVQLRFGEDFDRFVKDRLATLQV